MLSSRQSWRSRVELPPVAQEAFAIVLQNYGRTADDLLTVR